MDERRGKEVCGRKTHIDDLPDDCLIEILRYVDGDAYLPMERWLYDRYTRHPIQCASVCKRWHALVKYAVCSLHLTNFTEQMAHDVGDRYKCLTTLKFSNLSNHSMSNSPLIALAQHTPQLEHLEVRHFVNFPAPTVAQALDRWSRLKWLTLGGYLIYLNSEDYQPILDVLYALPSLEHLDLYYCNDDLPAVCTRVSKLTALKSLNLGCHFIPTEFTSRFCEVLRDLAVHDIEEPQLSDSLGLLTGLECLRIALGRRLLALPESLGRLGHLTSLTVHRCPQLVSLPSTLGQLTCLEVLKVWACDGLQRWPASFWNLQALQTLELSEVGEFPQTPGCLPCLENLKIEKFVRLPEDIGDLPNLRTLELREGQGVSELPGWLFKLGSLEVLELREWPDLAFLPGALGRLTGLRKLSLADCSNRLRALPESLRRLTRLETLKIWRLLGLQRLPLSIGQWGALECLEVSLCPCLQSLPWGLVKCSRLKSLQVGCINLKTLPRALGRLSALTTLDLMGCHSLVSLPRSIGSLRRLEYLNVSFCGRLSQLPGTMTELTALRRLLMQHCDRLEPLPQSLEQLRLKSLL